MGVQLAWLCDVVGDPGQVPAAVEGALSRAASELAPQFAAALEEPPPTVRRFEAALEDGCLFCGALPQEPCRWAVRTWPRAWTHAVRVAGRPAEDRERLHRDGWIAVLLELLRTGPVPLQAAAIQDARGVEVWSLETTRPGFREAVAELVRTGHARLVDGQLVGSEGR